MEVHRAVTKISAERDWPPRLVATQNAVAAGVHGIEPFTGLSPAGGAQIDDNGALASPTETSHAVSCRGGGCAVLPCGVLGVFRPDLEAAVHRMLMSLFATWRRAAWRRVFLAAAGS